MIAFHCPGCGQRYSVEDKFGGRKTTCCKCRAGLVVPSAEKSLDGVTRAPIKSFIVAVGVVSVFCAGFAVLLLTNLPPSEEPRKQATEGQRERPSSRSAPRYEEEKKESPQLEEAIDAMEAVDAVRQEALKTFPALPDTCSPCQASRMRIGCQRKTSPGSSKSSRSIRSASRSKKKMASASPGRILAFIHD